MYTKKFLCISVQVFFGTYVLKLQLIINKYFNIMIKQINKHKNVNGIEKKLRH